MTGLADRPNIVLIMTDQLRADWLGCAGHPVVRTPHIDALAAQGTRFTRFNVATPVCQPNRASILTGRYPSVHGLRHNGLHLPHAQVTFADVMRRAGYDTAMIGKSHLQPMTNRPQRKGPRPETGPEPEAQRDGASYSVEQPENMRATGDIRVPRPYYGFDSVDFACEHGDAPHGHYLKWLQRQRPDDWQALRDRANQVPHDYTCPQAFRTPLPEDLYPSAYIGTRTVEYLARQTPDRPFLAYVSFPDPHHPFNPPGKYWDLYDPTDFPLDLPFEANQTPNPVISALRDRFNAGTQVTDRQEAFMAPGRQLQEAMALSAGMMTMIDDQVGRIVAALKENGQWDNTVVIFNSDHGDFMGAFSMLLKGPYVHHSTYRVPFIWRDPALAGGDTDDALCSSIDIAPTLLARAGVAGYHGVQGRDIRAAGRREQLLIEFEDNAFPKPHFPDAPANSRTVLTDRHRLTVYHGRDWGELFDLHTDPDETRNLWNDPAAAGLRSEMLARLAQSLIGAVNTSPFPRVLA